MSLYRSMLYSYYVYIYRCVIWLSVVVLFFFKQKTAYEMRISDWSSDVCSSDLTLGGQHHIEAFKRFFIRRGAVDDVICAKIFYKRNMATRCQCSHFRATQLCHLHGYAAHPARSGMNENAGTRPHCSSVESCSGGNHGYRKRCGLDHADVGRQIGRAHV